MSIYGENNTQIYDSHEARAIFSFISEMETHLLLQVIDHKQVAPLTHTVFSAIRPVLFGVGLMMRIKIAG